MTSLVSRLCVLHGSRLGVRALSFCQDCALTAGLMPASSESAERKGWRPPPPFPPPYPFFAQPRPLLTGPPRGRDPATQQILIDCDSSVQRKRSCQALETNSVQEHKKKLIFPGCCLPNFDWLFCKRWCGLSCCSAH